ncbi:IBR domain-containing protein [Balamuthia mandrillaris]
MATAAMTVIARGDGSNGGGTWQYMAPELCSGNAEAASDVFSWGLVLFDLHFAADALKAQVQESCGGGREEKPSRPTLMEMVRGKEVHIPSHPNEHLRDLLRQVLQLDPKQRPTASQCLSHNYLWSHLSEDRVAERDRRHCLVCMEEKWLDEGLECSPPLPNAQDRQQQQALSSNHFACGQCLNGFVVSLLDAPPATLAQRGRHVPCLVTGCAAQPFPMEQLMAHLDDDGRKALMEVRSKAEEYMSQQAFQQRLQEERTQWEKESTTQRHRRCIIEEILTLQCPRCHQAFVDFDGCFALKCSRCNAGFCGWCLQDCGSDAHAHVRVCGANQAGGGLFGTFEAFLKAQRKRQERRLRGYLAGLSREESRHVRAALQKELADLNIRL